MAWPRSTPTPAATACTCSDPSAIRGSFRTTWCATTATGSSSSCRARGRPSGRRWSLCRAEGRRGLPRPELLAALKGVAKALDALNSRNGVPHLALNPDAVQLVNGQALAADFGLAAWFWLPSGQPLAEINPRYAPPELGANAVSRFCDPYSLALVYQEMLTGVHPLGAGARPSARAYSQPDLRRWSRPTAPSWPWRSTAPSADVSTRAWS